ncbi:hypothetical protein J2Z78_005046 [Streptomyces griseorubens]
MFSAAGRYRRYTPPRFVQKERAVRNGKEDGIRPTSSLA